MRTKGAETFIDVLIDAVKIVGLIVLFVAAIVISTMFMGAAIVRNFGYIFG